MPLSHQGWPNSEYHETSGVFRTLELVQPFWKLSPSTSFSQKLPGRSYPPALPTSLCHIHPPNLTSTLPTRMPPKHFCIENQWENLIEDLTNWTRDAGKPECLKRKHCIKNVKLQLQAPQAFESSLSMCLCLNSSISMFCTQLPHTPHVLPYSSHPQANKLCKQSSSSFVEDLVEGKCYSLWRSKDTHIMELSAWDAVPVS